MSAPSKGLHSGRREDPVRRAGGALAASYTVKGGTFVAEKARVRITKLGGTQWDLAPDGKCMVVLTPVESAEAPA